MQGAAPCQSSTQMLTEVFRICALFKNEQYDEQFDDLIIRSSLTLFVCSAIL